MTGKKEKASASKKALIAMKDWEGLTGFEFLRKEDYLAGEMTFRDAWHENIRWLEGLLGSAMNLPSGCDACNEEFESEMESDEE